MADQQLANAQRDAFANVQFEEEANERTVIEGTTEHETVWGEEAVKERRELRNYDSVTLRDAFAAFDADGDGKLWAIGGASAKTKDVLPARPQCRRRARYPCESLLLIRRAARRAGSASAAPPPPPPPSPPAIPPTLGAIR